jgi:hypothetical protein
MNTKSKEYLIFIGHLVLGLLLAVILAIPFGYEDPTLSISFIWGVYMSAVAHFNQDWGAAVVAGTLIVIAVMSAVQPDGQYPPELGVVAIIIWVGYWLIDHYTGAQWSPTQVEEKKGEWVLGYQESDRGNRRWVAAKKERGTTYCVDSDGNIREENYFFNNKQDALEAVQRHSDPLNQPEITEGTGKKAKRAAAKSKKVAKYAAYAVGGIIITILIISFLFGFVTELVTEDPEPRIVSISNPSESQYQVTVQNTGGAGQITARMYWVPEGQNYPNGNYPENPEEAGFDMHRTRTVQFNEGERRPIGITGTPPEGYGSYYFRVNASEVER